MIRIRDAILGPSADDDSGRHDDSAAVSSLIGDYLRQTEQEKAEHGLVPPAPGDGERLPEPYATEVLRPAEAYRGADVLLAVHDDDVAVGVVVLRAAEGGAEVKRLWVDPAHRGQRIAASLLDEVVSRTPCSVRLSVWEWRAPARAVYRRMGFVEVSAWDPRPGLVCLERPPR